jgi:lipopolysaccharide cholinephosphotransferase
MKIFRKDSMVIERKFEEKFKETQIWIDIFPMDGVRSGTVSIWWTFFVTKMLRNFLYTIIVDPMTLSGMEKYGTLLIKPWARMFGAHRIARWLDRFARRHDVAASSLIGNIAWGEGSFEAIDKNIFLPSAPLVFEDGEFSSPLHYDQHLKDLYGSYMELPPPEERKSHLGEDSYVFL